jgi:subtilisin family serine protease
VVIAIIMVLAGLSFYAFSAAKGFADKMEADTRVAIGHVGRHGKKDVKAMQAIASAPPATTARPVRVPGEYYVGFNASVSNPAATAQRLAGLAGGTVAGVYTRGTYGCGLRCPDANIGSLSGDPAVSIVDQARAIYLCQANYPPNIRRVFSNGINGQTATTPVNQFFGAPPSVYRMYRNDTIQGVVNTRVFLGGTSTASVTVAVIDSGVDNRHPDLNVVYAADFTGGNNPMDTGGHGTHVAGVVGAVDKTASGGTVGVYPGAPLVSLKVIASVDPSIAPWSEQVPGSSLAVYGALDYLIANAAAIPVCLMPFHTLASDPTMDAMVNTAAGLGVIMVAAAGQNGAGANFNLDTNPVSPACAAGAIAIGGMVDTDAMPGGFGGAGDDIYSNGGGSMSNYGSVIAFVGPSGNTTAGSGSYPIFSTIPLAGQAVNGLAAPYSNYLYGSPVAPEAQGQSFACAHVAGMMALLKDPQTNLGFILGAGRGVTTYHLQMNTRDQAVAALFNATHQTPPFQMINPLTGSAWQIIGFPRRVEPYMKALYGDYVTDPNGRQVPVANFYVNPNAGPSFLPRFPG